MRLGIGPQHHQRHLGQVASNVFGRAFAVSCRLHRVVVSKLFGLDARFVDRQCIVTNDQCLISAR
jgi:hypothetical protein